MKTLFSLFAFVVFAVVAPKKWWQSLKNEIFNPSHDYSKDVSEPKLKIFAMF